MSSINFFVPLTFQNQPTTYFEDILEIVDDYFYLGGKKAFVIYDNFQGEHKGAIELDDKSSLFNTSLKVASYATLILPLIGMTLKFILRSYFEVVLRDPHELLQEGIDINEEDLSNLEALMPAIKTKKEHPDITWYEDPSALSFTIKSMPGYRFKMPLNNTSRDDFLSRFDDLTKAYSALLAYNLDRLKVNAYRLLDLEHGLILVENAVEVNQDERDQEINYQTLAGLGTPITQLAEFFIKTKFNDFTLANLPIVNRSKEFACRERILLSSLKFSLAHGDGLVNLAKRFLRIEQIELICIEASRHRAQNLSLIKQIWQERKNELEQEALLYRYYELQRITDNPRKLVSSDHVDSLELNLSETKTYHANSAPKEGKSYRFTMKLETKKISMQEAIIETIQKINDHLLQAPGIGSLKSRRLIFLEKVTVSWVDFKRPHAILQDNWLKTILEKLVEKQRIFSIIRETAEGFYIQA